MKTLVAKQSQHLKAVRLKFDLIAEAGDWIILHEDDSVSVLSDAEIKEHYNIVDFETNVAPSVVPPKPILVMSQTPEEVKPKKNFHVRRKALSIEIEGKTLTFGAQMVRMLCYLNMATSGKRDACFNDVKNFVPEHEMDQTGTRLGLAEKFKFVEIDRKGRVSFCKLTNEGRYVIKELGETAMKYGAKI